MSHKDIVVSSRENYEAALERAEKAEAELAGVQKAAAEMRAALQSVASIVANWALDLGPNSAAQRDYKKLEHALSSNAGKDYFHRDEFKPLLEAAKAAVKAHESMFEQCASNSVFNAWGKEVSVLALNEARQLADSALDKAREKGLIS